MISQVWTQPFQNRNVITELINPKLTAKAGQPAPPPLDTSDPLFSEEDSDVTEVSKVEEPAEFEYDGEPMKIDAIKFQEMMQFINVDNLDDSLIELFSAHVRQDKVGVLKGANRAFT